MQGNTSPPQASTPGMSINSPTGNLMPHYLLNQRYRIIGLLGQGGMGAVYKAEDILGKKLIAVKEMSQSELHSPEEISEATEAFKREAFLLARLQHPNLPRTYDHFTAIGRLYLVMDFIEGETLEKHLEKAKNGHLPVDEVLKIGINLCDVLNYLHAQQPPIIFRDLKPGNIMLTPDGGLYLIDFGIARLFKPGQSSDTKALGSAGYAAPEQHGRAQSDERTDIYSLGATLHQLLSGDDPSQTPFQFAPLQLPNLPALSVLEALIMKMVALKADQRPASMAAVKKELEEISAKISSPPPPPLPAPFKPYIYNGHSDVVTAVTWSPDGAFIVSASNDKTVQVCNASSGQQVLTYRNHTSSLRAVTWSPGGKRIASGGQDKTIHIWSAATGDKLLVCTGHTLLVRTIAWSPDGRYIASGGDDNKVRIWDTVTGQNIFTYTGHSDSVSIVAWSPNGTRIVSGSYDETAQVWNAANGQLITTYRGHKDYVSAIAWSSDGKQIVSGSWDKTVQIWDVGTGQNSSIYRGHTRLLNAVTWLPNSELIASASKDKTVLIWDATTGDTIFTYGNHTQSVNALACSPDGALIASASDDKTVHIWQAK